MKTSVAFDWRCRHGFLTFGVNTPYEYILKYEPFYLESVASKITCPVLVIGNEDDKKAWQKQALLLYHALKCKKEYLFFTNKEDAGAHCQAGCRIYANDRIFDWIGQTLRNGVKWNETRTTNA